MTVKFLHTADWQMGMKALQAGEKAKEVRSQRYETAARVAELAKREAVHFVLLAGDLFEDHDIDDAVVRKTVAALDGFAPIPVFVLPGNHDPLVAGGVWDRQSWRRAGPHVRLLAEAKEMAVNDEVVIYPSPLRQKQSQIDPTNWIPVRTPGDDRIRIGVAHGSLDVLPGSLNFPIASARAVETGLDYLALGDWHSFLQHGRIVYSGTLEQTSFGEKDPGNVVIVEIAKAGSDPVIKKHRVGQLLWSEHCPAIRDATDVARLRGEIGRTGSLANRLVRVTPQILPDVSAAAVTDLDALRRELVEEAFFLDWPEETLTMPVLADVTLPVGIVADVDADLLAVLEGRVPQGPGREAASADLAVVQEARALLRRLALEVKK